MICLDVRIASPLELYDFLFPLQREIFIFFSRFSFTGADLVRFFFSNRPPHLMHFAEYPKTSASQTGQIRVGIFWPIELTSQIQNETIHRD